MRHQIAARKANASKISAVVIPSNKTRLSGNIFLIYNPRTGIGKGFEPWACLIIFSIGRIIRPVPGKQ